MDEETELILEICAALLRSHGSERLLGLALLLSDPDEPLFDEQLFDELAPGSDTG